MTRVAWCTDIHLNFAKPAALADFLAKVRDCEADFVLVGGDIGEASDVGHYLALLREQLARPICFVLGNHDFYFGSIEGVRTEVRHACAVDEQLIYLTDGAVVELTPSTALIGHDGWADGRVGDYDHSTIMLNDYRLIRELAGVNKGRRLPLLQFLGDEAAAAVRRVLPAALERYESIYFLTHVPPLREACWHEGAISDDEWSPHFTCLAVGTALLEIMRAYPHRQLTVLCGHTHSSGTTQPLPNLTIFTGAAVYGFPALNRVFVLD
jgi:3',5'-cyclic-AMP phosphodiesterase